MRLQPGQFIISSRQTTQDILVITRPPKMQWVPTAITFGYLCLIVYSQTEKNHAFWWYSGFIFLVFISSLSGLLKTLKDNKIVIDQRSKTIACKQHPLANFTEASHIELRKIYDAKSQIVKSCIVSLVMTNNQLLYLFTHEDLKLAELIGTEIGNYTQKPFIALS